MIASTNYFGEIISVTAPFGEVALRVGGDHLDAAVAIRWRKAH